MKNLTTLTNVKTLSNKSANKIKGGQLDVIASCTTVITTKNYTLTLK